jgi:hypothetical protein
MKRVIGVAVLGTLWAAQPGAAQTAPRVFAEGLVGGVVPTFDIAETVTSGAAFGGTLGVRTGPRWVLMGEFDYGMHEDEGRTDVDISTRHYIGKVGYSLTGARERGWEAIVNLGAGAVTFDVEDAESFTYFAINAGAKLSYSFNRRFALVLSPQGDIAFSDEAEVGTDNAWVWPITAGLRINF